ncbi:E3 ubiquitin-protein ligase MARCHF5-like isoform X3 [Thrips palmi]|uniref:E3 ubiquitin-protein ligase MARCHF5 n=1 Tax=Thrips palmi TaxID=161013 RepID=A0A6P8YM98_THRPL|nr:E3 ubiquitin-protein ligase MARCHF5-like isoform X3 [Thrips palmi]
MCTCVRGVYICVFIHETEGLMISQQHWCVRASDPIMSESASDRAAPQDVLDELSNASSPPVPQLSSSTSSEDDKRQCWVCLNSDEDEEDAEELAANGPAEWVQPCKCKGTAKWVHRACLNRFIDEKRKVDDRVKCPQCKTRYIISAPKMGYLYSILDEVDMQVHRISPIVVGFMLAKAVYWCAVTHGAVTVMTVMGCDEGLSLLESSSPILLLLALPAIPTALILSKMICWEDRLWLTMRNHYAKIPFMRYILPSFAPTSQGPMERLPPLFSNVCGERTLSGALLMPSIAALVGRLLFDSVENNLHRTLLGGLTFVAVKGVLKIYLKHQRYMRVCRSVIMNYPKRPESQQSDGPA